MKSLLAALLGIVAFAAPAQSAFVGFSTATVGTEQQGVYADTTYPPSDATNVIFTAALASTTACGRSLFRENNDSWFSYEPTQGNFTLTQLRQRVAIATGSAAGQYGGIYVWQVPPSPTWDAPAGNTFYGQFAVPSTRVLVATATYVYNLTTTVVSAICSDKLLVKLGNENDFWFYSGDSTAPAVSRYLNWASTAAKAVADVCPNAGISLTNIAYPSTSPWAGAGNGYTSKHFFGDVYADATLRSLIHYVGLDIYPDSQSHDVALSSMTGMMQAYGGGTVKPIIIWETNVTGGAPVDSNEYEKALYLTTNTARALGSYSMSSSTGVVAVFAHTLKQDGTTQGFGLMDANGTALTAYGTMARLSNKLNGFAPLGRLDANSTKCEKFTKNGLDVYVVWRDAGTGTLADIGVASPPTRARITQYDGSVSALSANGWNTFSVTREPLVIEELTVPVTAGVY